LSEATNPTHAGDIARGRLGKVQFELNIGERTSGRWIGDSLSPRCTGSTTSNHLATTGLLHVLAALPILTFILSLRSQGNRATAPSPCRRRMPAYAKFWYIVIWSYLFGRQPLRSDRSGSSAGVTTRGLRRFSGRTGYGGSFDHLPPQPQISCQKSCNYV